MAKLIATIKAIVTRLVFAAHGMLAIWQVTIFKKDSYFWYLSAPVLLLFFEGVFTLTIKRNQEWKWFCPSVFLYLASVVPAIWLLELDKLDKKHRARHGFVGNSTAAEGFRELDQLLGQHLQLPTLSITPDTWLTLIEQFLMLILILGRWMLPKGDLTRDQLSQLLLVYIGTAADIIEFFDTFQDETIGRNPVLTALTLAIWSWSLLQFTVVLTATKSSRRSRISAPSNIKTPSTKKKKRSRANKRTGFANYCCSVDVWAIIINILLQDAPFVTFRLLLICYYRIISYMNVFFTCKNTLVIALQLYRLYVVYAERKSSNKKSKSKVMSKSNRASPDISFVLAAMDAGVPQYFPEGDVVPGGRTKRGRRGKQVVSSASCCELMPDLGIGGVNPASNLRLLLAEDGPQVHRGRRKSLSADNLKESRVFDEEELEEEATKMSSEEEAEAEEDSAPQPGEEDSSADDSDLLAELSPTQLNLLRAAASRGQAMSVLRGTRQDTGYSTASSSHGSVRDARSTPGTTAAYRIQRNRNTQKSSRSTCSPGQSHVRRLRDTEESRAVGRASRKLKLLQGEERV